RSRARVPVAGGAGFFVPGWERVVDYKGWEMADTGGASTHAAARTRDGSAVKANVRGHVVRSRRRPVENHFRQGRRAEGLWLAAGSTIAGAASPPLERCRSSIRGRSARSTFHT